MIPSSSVFKPEITVLPFERPFLTRFPFFRPGHRTVDVDQIVESPGQSSLRRRIRTVYEIGFADGYIEPLGRQDIRLS